MFPSLKKIPWSDSYRIFSLPVENPSMGLHQSVDCKLWLSAIELRGNPDFPPPNVSGHSTIHLNSYVTECPSARPLKLIGVLESGINIAREFWRIMEERIG